MERRWEGELKLRLMCVVPFCLSLLLLLLPLFGCTDAEPEESITAPLAKVEARADGFISPGEWDDAEVVVLGYSGFYGYLYVKHNWTYLWVHLDCPSDTIKSPLGWDNGWVAIDPDMSGGSEPQEYDMLFHSHGHLAFIGDGVEPIQGSQWGILRGHYPEDTPEKYWELRNFIIANFSGSGPSWGPTEASETFHSYWEFQIPLEILDLIPGLNITNMFGFCASVQDYDEQRIADWPVTKSTGNFWPGPDSPQGNYTPPDSWGILTLGPESLSEEPSLPLPPPPLPPPPINVFEVLWDNKTFHVAVNSSSNVSDFYFSQPAKEIGFNVTGPYGTTGLCNVTIPIELLDGAFMVRIDELNTFHILTRNETHTSLYFVYSHSTQKVQIIGTIVIPEFSLYAQLIFMTIILVVAILERVVPNKRGANRKEGSRISYD